MYYKYPRTYHLPFSLGLGSDDKVLTNFEDYFENRQVVISEKMDGENTTVYSNYCHARSIDSKHASYHSWLLSYIQSFNYLLKENERVCGEYLFAQHSIHYDDLKSYFLAFSIWQDETCLSWESTVERCKELSILTVPVLYVGNYDSKQLRNCISKVAEKGGEGVVMRLACEFKYSDFCRSVVKYVRANHVQTDEHWSKGKITQNNMILN